MKIQLVFNRTVCDPVNTWNEIKLIEVEIPLEDQDGWQLSGAVWPEEENERALDWGYAEEQLEELEKSYTEIGSAGYFALTTVIRPLRHRFNSGERSEALFDAIMAVPE